MDLQSELISWLLRKVDEYRLLNPLEYNDLIEYHHYELNRSFNFGDILNSIKIKTKYHSTIYLYHYIREQKIRLELNIVYNKNYKIAPFYRFEIDQISSTKYQVKCNQLLKHIKIVHPIHRPLIIKSFKILSTLDLAHESLSNWIITLT